MLSLSKLSSDQSSASRGMNEIVPFMLMLTDGLILNKNGSLTAAFDLSGIDLEGKMQAAYDHSASNQEHAFGAFDEKVTLDQFVDRSRTYDYTDSKYEDDVSATIDGLWKPQFVGGFQFKNRLTLFLTYTPSKGGDGLIDRVAAKVSQEGMSWPSALFSALKSHFSVTAEMHSTSEEIAGYVRLFEEQLGSYASSFASGRINRLRGSDLLGAAYRRVNLDQSVERIRVTDAPIYLDSLLPANVVQSDPEVNTLLRLTGDKVRYVGALTVKEWPTSSFAGMLDHLLTIAGEFTIHHSFRFVSNAFADKHTAKMESHHKDLSVKFKDMVRQAVTGREPEQFDKGRLALSDDAAMARASITANNERFGWYHFSIIAVGESPEEVEATLAEIRKAVARYEIVCMRESMGLLSSYAGNIPGNSDLLIRWFFFSTSAFANLINLRTVTSGSLFNAHYSEQARQKLPALTAFTTQHNTPFFLSTHVDDLGHSFIVGPPGAGKSVLAMFLVAQFRKYERGNVYIFDKDRTCFITTQLLGGQHIDLGSQESKGVMNPYSLLKHRNSDGTLMHFEWINRFTIYLLESLSNTKLSAEKGHFAKVEQAITSAANSGDPSQYQLSQIALMLNDSDLQARIQPWLNGSEKGKYFDNAEDAFDLGSFTTTEMGALLEKDPVTAMAVLDYSVYRISMKLADNCVEPTIIYIEEVWFMLKTPAFEAIIENWLRVLRKKNASLWFATQSLSELAGSSISAAIINSISTRIFLPNEDARSDLNYDLYTKTFGLNDAQVEQVQRGIRKTNYLIVQGSFSRMVWARFQPTILACLRSDALAKKVFAKWFAKADEESNWKAKYLEEMVHEYA